MTTIADPELTSADQPTPVVPLNRSGASTTGSAPDLDAAAEAAAIERVLAGEVEAYDLLVRSFMRRAYAVAYRILGHQQDSEDVVQDAFFTALERIDTFDTSRRFGPWFLRIVANHAHNQRESRAVRERGIGVDTDTVPGRSAPDSDVEGVEIRAAFEAALDDLAPRPRLIVQLADVDGFAPTEIAGMLNLSPGTVRGYLFEARQALRRVLEPFKEMKHD